MNSTVVKFAYFLQNLTFKFGSKIITHHYLESSQYLQTEKGQPEWEKIKTFAATLLKHSYIDGLGIILNQSEQWSHPCRVSLHTHVSKLQICE